MLTVFFTFCVLIFTQQAIAGNLTCAAYGLVQDCTGASDGSCQIGCAIALCDGGKCDQRDAQTCKCDGGRCWQEGCGSLSCDGGECSASNVAPDGCICPSCTGTTTSSTKPPTPSNVTCADYGLVQDCQGADDGACQIGCVVSLCDGGKCDQRNSHSCRCDGGNCWQEGCKDVGCDGGSCTTDDNPPAGCTSYSCTGTTTTSSTPGPGPTPGPTQKTCDDYGLVQDCTGANDGSCQLGCDVAQCDGGKCDQRYGSSCKCDGGNCWQMGCGSASCDGGGCSTSTTAPDGCICPSCQQGFHRYKSKKVQSISAKIIKF